MRKLKSIKITLETMEVESWKEYKFDPDKPIVKTREFEGPVLESIFVVPEYRHVKSDEENKNSLFKKQHTSPVKWFKEILSGFHNL